MVEAGRGLYSLDQTVLYVVAEGLRIAGMIVDMIADWRCEAASQCFQGLEAEVGLV